MVVPTTLREINKKKIRLFMFLALFAILTVTACGKKYTIDDYIGYQFAGKDLWGNSLVIDIRSLDEDKLAWTYTDTYGEGEESFMISEKLSTNYKDGETPFNLSGKVFYADYLYEYSGVLSFKDGKVIITYKNGYIMSNSLEGGSSSYSVGTMEDNRTITLEKVINNK